MEHSLMALLELLKSVSNKSCKQKDNLNLKIFYDFVKADYFEKGLMIARLSGKISPNEWLKNYSKCLINITQIIIFWIIHDQAEKKLKLAHFQLFCWNIWEMS